MTDTEATEVPEPIALGKDPAENAERIAAFLDVLPADLDAWVAPTADGFVVTTERPDGMAVHAKAALTMMNLGANR